MPEPEDITWGGLLHAATQRLEAAGIAEARRAALWLLGDVVAASPARLLAYPERPATTADARALEALLARRLRHEPTRTVAW